MTTRQLPRPIIIAPYDPGWRTRFEDERAMILRACGADAFVRIEHIGSTSVPGLDAKPIVDIMPGIASLDGFAPCIAKIEALGYTYVPEFEHDTQAGPGMPFRRYFRKDLDGVRAFHLHVVEVGSAFWRDHPMFRNWLRVHPADARAYADVKRRVAAEYNETMLAQGIDINIGYTDRKSDIINEIMARARDRVARNQPVVIEPYDPAWPALYRRERAIVGGALGDAAVAIEHVGSTSIPGLASKPVIDIAAGVRTMAEARERRAALEAAGYPKDQDEDAFPDWSAYGRYADGIDAVHLHVVPFGGDRWNRYLLFRDHLRARPELVMAYAELKRTLAEEFGKDRLGYVEAKTEFVEHVLHLARTAGLMATFTR